VADFDLVRKGLAKVVGDQVAGLRVYPYQPDSALEYPCLIISHVGEVQFLPILQAGGFQAPLICLLRVSSSSVVEANQALEQYRWPNGEKSLFAAVNTDNTLDGSVNHGYVVSAGEPERDPDGQDHSNEWQSQIVIQITHSVS